MYIQWCGNSQSYKTLFNNELQSIWEAGQDCGKCPVVGSMFPHLCVYHVMFETGTKIDDSFDRFSSTFRVP